MQFCFSYSVSSPCFRCIQWLILPARTTEYTENTEENGTRRSHFLFVQARIHLIHALAETDPGYFDYLFRRVSEFFYGQFRFAADVSERDHVTNFIRHTRRQA